MVVPHGENVTWNIQLSDESRWQPETATIEIPGMQPTNVSLSGNQYQVELPPRTKPTDVMVRVGDFYQSVVLDPKIRPELVSAKAMVDLPEYLQLPDSVDRDVRGGTLSVVEGSVARVAATASRELDSASINDQPVDVELTDFASDQVAVKEIDEMSLVWTDRNGLAGREPFDLMIRPLVDEAPSVVTQELPRQAVILDSEQLNFRALSADDFGIKRCLLYTSPSPRDQRGSRMPSSA